MDGLFNTSGVPVWVTVNKLNLVPNTKVPGLVGVFRNRVSLGTRKPYVSLVFFFPFMHRSSCFPDIHFAEFTRNFIDDTVLFSDEN